MRVEYCCEHVVLLNNANDGKTVVKKVGAAQLHTRAQSQFIDIMAGSVAFLGGGMMAEAMIKGFLSSGVRRKELLHVFDPAPARQKIMSERYGVSCYGGGDAGLCVQDKDIVVVAVKPQYVELALKSVVCH